MLGLFLFIDIMENNLENKENFFMIYWKQDVAIKNKSIGPVFKFEVNESTITDIDNYLLKLKSISEISDEDAIEVAKIYGWIKILSDNGNANAMRIYLTKSDNAAILATNKDWEILDFLRSKGYLLPWMGISTEELISRGWAVTTNLKKS